MNEAVKIAREQTKQEQVKALAEVLKSPMAQALITWLVVESAQRYAGFGSVSGSVLEGATMAKLFDIEKISSDIATLTKSLAPIVPMIK